MNPRFSLLPLVPCLWILVSLKSQALVDTNANGMSDLWEKDHNDGQLFTALDPQADPDGDGWTNVQEATAGTNPFDANPPGGYIQPDLEHHAAVYITGENGPEILTPEIYTLTWPSFLGKKYLVCASTDLTAESWIQVGDSLVGDGSGLSHAIAITQPDGGIPEKLFFRIQIEDTDSDGDLLTDYEEYLLGTNPYSMYSDDDFLSDTLEVFEYQTDPASYDSDHDGVPDHDEQPGLSGQINGVPNKYAPGFNWVIVARDLSYAYDETSASPPVVTYGNLSKWKSWDGSGESSSPLAARIPLGGLKSRQSDFPVADRLPAVWSYWTSSVSSFCVASDHSEYAWLENLQARLLTTTPAETSISKYLMTVSYSGYFSDGPTGIRSTVLTVPAGELVSPAEIMGDEYEPAADTHLSQDFLAPEFMVVATNGQSWDNTGAELWTSVGVGKTIVGRLDGGGDLTEAIHDKLEIGVVQESGTFISLSDVSWWSHGCNFKISGLLGTDDAGEQIVLRLKANPSVIFGSMRVSVFDAREIPVSIFRIWDSRVPASAVAGGLGDATIVQKLNDVFGPQANIHFTLDPSSGTVDMRNVPGYTTDRPLAFGTGGEFSSDTKYGAAEGITRSHYPNKARLNICIVENLDRGGDLGVTYLQRFCVVDSGADAIVYAHEVGHALDLAFKATGAQNSHDRGPWPSFWKNKGYTGMMFDSRHAGITSWLRWEDWHKANTSTTHLQ